MSEESKRARRSFSDEFKRLKKRLQRAEMEREILKKPQRISRGSHIEIRMGQAAS